MTENGLAASAGAADSVPAALEATNLAKRFGAQLALGGVDLRIEAGQVVALLGENGSGKSTLVKILAGYHVPEPGGALRINGRGVPLPVPLGRAHSVGLSFVYQDLGLANELQVVENLFVGHRITRGIGSAKLINWGAERRLAREIFTSYGVELDPSAAVGRLRPTAQALLAIVRAVWELGEYRERYGASGGVLVLDEPTVFLPEHEKVFLYDLVRRVTRDGLGVLFVSHDMTAVREIADRAAVLRDGAKVGDASLRQTSDAELIELVSGHHMSREVIERAISHRRSVAAAGERDAGERDAAHVTRDGPPVQGPGDGPPVRGPNDGPGSGVERERGSVALSVRGLCAGRARNVSFDVHAGEILGVAGLLGAGSEDLPYALFGDIAGATGEITLAGFSGQVSRLTPGRARKLGVALVPADRKQHGVAAGLPVALNMLSLSFEHFTVAGVLRLGRIRQTAAERAETYDVRPRKVTLNMSALSGGNQQKVVLARWLEQGPRVMLLHEPTQGVDVATRQQIYELMRERARRGVAIVWVSTDFDELATISDRVLLCNAGVIVGEVVPPLSRDRITSEVYAAAARGAGEGAGVPA